MFQCRYKPYGVFLAAETSSRHKATIEFKALVHGKNTAHWQSGGEEKLKERKCTTKLVRSEFRMVHVVRKSLFV